MDTNTRERSEMLNAETLDMRTTELILSIWEELCHREVFTQEDTEINIKLTVKTQGQQSVSWICSHAHIRILVPLKIKKPNAWSLSCCRNKLKFVVCSCNLIIREKESEFHIHHDNPQIYHRGISSLRRNNSPVKEQTIKCCEGTIRPGHNANVILFLLNHLPPACRACFLEAWAQQKWSEAGGCCVYLLGILLGTRR